MTTKNTKKTTTSSMALFTLRLCDYLSIADNAGGLRGREGQQGREWCAMPVPRNALSRWAMVTATRTTDGRTTIAT